MNIVSELAKASENLLCFYLRSKHLAQVINFKLFIFICFNITGTT